MGILKIKKIVLVAVFIAVLIWLPIPKVSSKPVFCPPCDGPGLRCLAPCVMRPDDSIPLLGRYYLVWESSLFQRISSRIFPARKVTIPRPPVKYRSYGNGLYNKKTKNLEAYFLKKEDELPKKITLGGEKFTVNKIEVEKNYSDPEHGFSVYLEVFHRGRNSPIGFWYFNERDPLEDCSKSDCGGVLSVEMDRWETDPSLADKEKGVTKLLFIKFFSLFDIDYNFETDDWNYIEVGTQLYQEKEYPKTTF